MEKYGKENFKFQIICICFDNDCDKYEKEYMDKYNTLVPNGYNLRQAGNNGRHSEETKKKISEAVRLNFSKLTPQEKQIYIQKRSGSNNHQFGKKRTQAEKDKMVKNRKDFKKVNCYNLKNEFINTFYSLADAARKTGSDTRSISKCCKGKAKSSNGFIWKFNI